MKKLYAAFILTAVFAFSASTSFGQVIASPGFESGTGSSDWTQSSTNFGTPLCDAACGTCGGPCAPQAGSWYVWFGGAGIAELGTVEQSITMPTSTSATMTIYVFMPVNSGSAGDRMEVLVDGNSVFSMGTADSNTYGAGYVQESIDMTAYADGMSHTLRIEGEEDGNGTGVTNFLVDELDMTWETPAGIFTESFGTNVRFYPNPVQNMINVDFNLRDRHDVTVEVVSVLGQVVASEQLNEVQSRTTQLDVSQFPAGNYLLRLTAGSEVHTQQIVVVD